MGFARTCLLGLFSFLTAVCAAGIPTAFCQESASYIMDRVTISSMADIALSPNFEMAVTFGQESPVGSVSVCNAGAFQSNGFWSIAGDTPASIFLQIVHNPGNPSELDLFWSGSAGQFEIYRGEIASSVSVPGNSLLTTSLCAESDTPPGNVIHYYMVLPVGN